MWTPAAFFLINAIPSSDVLDQQQQGMLKGPEFLEFHDRCDPAY
jgi:hypothetical protein